MAAILFAAAPALPSARPIRYRKGREPEAPLPVRAGYPYRRKANTWGGRSFRVEEPRNAVAPNRKYLHQTQRSGYALASNGRLFAPNALLSGPFSRYNSRFPI
jgi:hypothetical protein